MRLPAQNVVDEGREVAAGADFDENPRAVRVHPFDGFAEADGAHPVRDEDLANLLARDAVSQCAGNVQP